MLTKQIQLPVCPGAELLVYSCKFTVLIPVPIKSGSCSCTYTPVNVVAFYEYTASVLSQHIL